MTAETIFELGIPVVPMYDEGISDEELYKDNTIDLLIFLREVGGYTYTDHTYNGTIKTGSSKVDYSITSAKFTENNKNMMNDFARFIGAMWRVDNGETVKEIVFDGATYTWDTTGTLKGSNWNNGSISLVSKVVEKILEDQESLTEGTAYIDLLINGDQRVRVNVKIV